LLHQPTRQIATLQVFDRTLALLIGPFVYPHRLLVPYLVYGRLQVRHGLERGEEEEEGERDEDDILHYTKLFLLHLLVRQVRSSEMVLGDIAVRM
jgi:hypothetical protein